MALENTAASDDGATPGGEAVDSIKLENLADMLEDEPAAANSPGGGEDGAAAGDGNEKAKPDMFNDLAERLEIELDDLYGLKVSVGDGETVTIEELKALHTTQDALAVRELEFEETRVTKEGELRQAQNEIAEIVAALPNGTLSPEVLEKLRAKNAARLEVEQSRTLEAIPTWQNEDARTADLVGMSAHLERFGFPAGHVANVSDHRMFVFIRESYLREQRIQKALEKVRAGKPNPTTSTKTTGKAPGKTGAAPRKSDARNGLEQFFSDV
jgi:hypothetical protein